MNITATLIGQMIVFILLIWFIKKFLWVPMLTMLEDRQKRVADGLAAAERGEKQQELAEANAADALKEAKDQASDIIGQAQRRASEIVDEAKVDAVAEGDRIKLAANAEIDQEVNRAREQLRKEVSDIALQGVRKVVGKEVDATSHSKILDDLIGQI